MPHPDTGASAGKPRSLPLVLAWAVVLLGLLSAVGYALWAPTQSRDQGRTEVRIALSDIPTLAEDTPAKDAAGQSSAVTPDSAAIAVSEFPVTPQGATAGAAPSTQAAPQPVEVPQIAPTPALPQGSAAEDSQSVTALISPAPATQPEEDERPKIAVVMSGLGLSETATETAIERLPSAVTLSFTPYGDDFERWLGEARAKGHEVMIDLPMEPASFPNSDPGPRALITSLSAEENLARLAWILGRGSDFIGVTGVMGSRFSASREDMMPILNALKDRGLIYLDNRSTDLGIAAQLAAEIGLPRALSNRTIDESHASRVVIDARLAQIERVALTAGFAVAIAHPFPLTLERLAAWTETLDQRGFALVPITAVANRQPL